MKINNLLSQNKNKKKEQTAPEILFVPRETQIYG